MGRMIPKSGVAILVVALAGSAGPVPTSAANACSLAEVDFSVPLHALAAAIDVKRMFCTQSQLVDAITSFYVSRNDGWRDASQTCVGTSAELNLATGSADVFEIHMLTHFHEPTSGNCVADCRSHGISSIQTRVFVFIAGKRTTQRLMVGEGIDGCTTRTISTSAVVYPTPELIKPDITVPECSGLPPNAVAPTWDPATAAGRTPASMGYPWGIPAFGCAFVHVDI